jgi:ABC-2 type transport system permease protein
MARDQTGQPRSAYDITFPSAILWGVVGCVATFAVSLVVERTRGTYQRLRLSPMSGAEILAGKGLACFVACAVDVMLLVAIGVFVFGMRAGSWPGLVLAAACTGFCFVGAMMFVAVLGKTEASVAGAGWALFILWMMFGGGMIPLIAMPPWMEAASNFSPVKWAIYAIEGAVWRDLSFAELLKPCGILVGVGTGLFLLGLALFRRSDP